MKNIQDKLFEKLVGKTCLVEEKDRKLVLYGIFTDFNSTHFQLTPAFSIEATDLCLLEDSSIETFEKFKKQVEGRESYFPYRGINVHDSYPNLMIARNNAKRITEYKLILLPTHSINGYSHEEFSQFLRKR